MEEMKYQNKNFELIKIIQENERGSAEYEKAASELIMYNKRLINTIMIRLKVKQKDWDDVYQECLMRLMNCAHKFDLTQNTQFSSYLVPALEVIIRRYFDKQTLVSGLQSIKKKYYQTKSILEQSENTEVNEEDIVNEFEGDYYYKILQAQKSFQTISLDSFINDFERDTTLLDFISDPHYENYAQNKEIRADLDLVMSYIKGKDKEYVERYFFNDETLVSIAEQENVTKQAIDYKVRRALGYLKLLMQPETLQALQLTKNIQKQYYQILEIFKREASLIELMDQFKVSIDSFRIMFVWGMYRYTRFQDFFIKGDQRVSSILKHFDMRTQNIIRDMIFLNLPMDVILQRYKLTKDELLDLIRRIAKLFYRYLGITVSKEKKTLLEKMQEYEDTIKKEKDDEYEKD